MLKRSLSFAVVALLLSASLPALAQRQLNTGQNYIGFDLGFTSSTLVGADNMFWALQDPDKNIGTYLQFKDPGVGFGLVAGAKLGVALSPSFDLEGKLRFISNSMSQKETRSDFPCPDPSNAGATTTVNNDYSLTFTNVNLSALAHVAFGSEIYGIGGFGFSSVLSNSVGANQTIDAGTNSCSYIDQMTGAPSGITEINRASSSVNDYFNTSRADIQIGVGAVAPLGSSSILDAELILSYPLTKMFSTNGINSQQTIATAYGLATPANPGVVFASFTIGIRFPFGGSSDGVYTDNSSTSTSSDNGVTINNRVDADGKVDLRGRVTNSNNDPVDATMTVVDLTTNEVVATDRTDRNGNYDVRVKAPGRYSVTADADGYLFGTAYYEIDKDGRILHSNNTNIKLAEATTGRTRLLVFFDFDKAELQSASYPELNRAVRLMKAVPTMEVEIAGYTDSKGTPEYNKDLSQRRANAVRDYLIKNGVAKNRLTARGYGMDSPVATNDTDEGRAENRRVEFVVLKK